MADIYTSRMNRRWWDEDKGDAHESVIATVQQIDSKQSSEQARLWDFYRLFDAKEAAQARGKSLSRRDPRLALNVVRAAVNTVHARIVQNSPRPTYLTLRQGEQGRRRAKMTQAYSDGCLYHQDAYNVGGEIAQSAAIFGTGVGKVYQGPDGRPALDNIFLGELRVDRNDGMHRKPRNVYHWRPVSRDDLFAQFEGDAEATKLIDSAPPASDSMTIYKEVDADRVAVCEAHRRPWAPGGNDGRHILALENGTLIDEPWLRDSPYVWLRWGLRTLGMWGYGISEQLEDLQFEINMLLMRIQEQMIWAGPKVYVERGSSINFDDLSNEIWGIVEYSGTPPQMSTFATVHPEMFQQLDRLVARSADEIGVSEFAMRSEKPAGLNSGKALRTFSDLETAKFAYFGKGYERLLRDISMQNLALAHEAPDDDKMEVTLPVRRYRTRYLEKISRKDIIGAEDDFVCQVFPTSQLAQAPAQKLEQVGEMFDKGILTKEEYLQLLDFPDLENATSLASASLDYIDMCIDKILEDGDNMRPEPWTVLPIAIPRVTNALMRAEADRIPEERYSVLSSFLLALTEMKQKADAAAQAAAAPPPTAVQPGAMPPPDPSAAVPVPQGAM